jgi:hypothetical protein
MVSKRTTEFLFMLAVVQRLKMHLPTLPGKLTISKTLLRICPR